jgi:hypothetical protein
MINVTGEPLDDPVYEFQTVDDILRLVGLVAIYARMENDGE